MEQYVAQYFKKTRKIIASEKPETIVTLQFFQRKDNAILAGMMEVIQLLKTNTNTDKYKIKYLPDRSKISSGEVVLELEGPYIEFGLYEGVIDGILSRMTSLATNAAEVVKAANGKQVVFMGDRSDHYLNQSRDGLAIAIGGIKTQVTDAHVSHHDGEAIGTIPHALIQMFEGDLVKALYAYKKNFPNQKVTALVDFNNDVLSESLKVLSYFQKDLFAIRVDTSANMSDAMFLNDEEYGVTPNMIKTLRKNLDSFGGKHVKIIVSSGFSATRIKQFEELETPVDIYGVGASLLHIGHTYTADAVKLNGKPLAKAGRKYRPNPRLIEFGNETL